MPRSVVSLDCPGRLPAFSHAVVAGAYVYVSGTLGTAGSSFDIVPGGVGPQTAAALRNVELILRGCNATLDDVVKVQVYLTDMSTFSEMNDAYTQVFRDNPPARITVGCTALAGGAAVELDCIAYIGA